MKTRARIIICIILITLPATKIFADVNKNSFTLYKIGNATLAKSTIDDSTEALVLKMILQQLPEYDINFRDVDYDTAFNNITTGDNACLRNLIKTPARDEYFIFSQPQTLFLGLRVYFSPSMNSDYMNNFEQLSISEIIDENPELHIGIEGNRAYGNHISKELEELPSVNKFMRFESDGENLMIAMLLKGRFDMLLEYPEVMDFKSRQILPDVTLRSISPKSSEPLIYGRLACSQSDASSQFIKKFNNALDKIYHSDTYLSAHLALIKKPHQKLFTELFSDFLIQQPN